MEAVKPAPSSGVRMHRRPGSMAMVTVVFAVFSACSYFRGPAGFWKLFRPELVSKQSVDQGPWGGSRSIRWHAKGPTGFLLLEVRTFAESHGWKLKDQCEYPPTTTSTSLLNGHGNAECNPTFMQVPSVVMKFETGWIREDPGSGKTNPAFGFVQVSNDGSELYMFHFWGNG